jgi:hypothetical protein
MDAAKAVGRNNRRALRRMNCSILADYASLPRAEQDCQAILCSRHAALLR